MKKIILSLCFVSTLCAATPPEFPRADSSGVPKKKSPILAATLSFIVPGVGEAYAGNFSSSGKYFVLAEGVFLASGISTSLYGSQVQSDARTYAEAHAGANPALNDDTYYFNIENYSSRQEYNEDQARRGTPERMYDEAHSWRWSSASEREKYQSQRLSSSKFLNISDLVFTALVMNHLASAINAGLAAGRHNRSLSMSVLPDREWQTLNLSINYTW